MKKIILILGFALSFNAISAEKASIAGISEDQSIIKLDDGSIWSVNAVDQFELATWLVGEDVVINDKEDQIYNIDDDSSVDVNRIR